MKIKFDIPAGIGWQNALGVAFAQADHTFFPIKVQRGQREHFITDAHERLLQTVRKWQPGPEKVDEWLQILSKTWPFEDEHRRSRLMLKMFKLASPEVVAAAAAEVLGDMIFDVMFFDATHTMRLDEETALFGGTRFSEVSEFLSSGLAAVYSMAEELRTDADLLQSEEECKVTFARMAYTSLIPFFERGESLDYEIDSMLQLMTDSNRSNECEEASEQILEELVERFPDVVEQRAYSLIQEYRRGIGINISVRSWEEIKQLIDSYGLVSVWLPRGSLYIDRELSRWRAMFKSERGSSAKAAMLATSYLVINLIQDRWGMNLLRKIFDETLAVIGSGFFLEPGDIVSLLVRRILIASENDPDLIHFMSSKLRDLALDRNMPSLITGVYAILFKAMDDEMCEEEAAKLRGLLESSSLSQEMNVAITFVLEQTDMLHEKAS